MLFNRTSEKEGIPVDQLRLTVQGKNLAGNDLSIKDKTLKSFNIQTGSTIHLLLRLKGG